MRRLIEESGLTDRVELAGSLSEDDVMRRLGGADLFVLASRAEPLGVAYMEAMALGVATVGTAAGGVREIIDDGEDGVLVPPGDASRLAETMRSLLGDEPARRRLGEAGRRKIVEKFDSRIGARTLYDRVRRELESRGDVGGAPRAR